MIIKKSFFILCILLLTVWTACQNPADDKKNSPDFEDLNGVDQVGESGTLHIGNESLELIYVKDSIPVTMPFGIDDDEVVALSDAFFLSQTEISNAVAAEVLQWAYDTGKFSDNLSDSNGIDGTAVKFGGQELYDLDHEDAEISFGSGQFSVSAQHSQQPVSFLSLYGAVILCNWLTEMRDGNQDQVVYSGIDSDWIISETTVLLGRTGYRLPTEEEWEYAARYLGGEVPVYGSISRDYIALGHDDYSIPDLLTEGYNWTPGEFASGAYTDIYNSYDSTPENEYPDGKDACDSVAIYRYYWIEDYWSWVDKGTSSKAAVGSLGESGANALGFLDMSGNVFEWCFTESDSEYVIKGGSWGSTAEYLQIGYQETSLASSLSRNVGLRILRGE